METPTPRISPLRQRMLDDMRMRKLADKTQTHYLRAVRQLAKFLRRSPDTASVEDLRAYQLHLVDQGTSPVSLNAALTGLKFFFEVTVGDAERMAKMQPVRVPRTLPVVLSRDEVTRLISNFGLAVAVANRRSRSDYTPSWPLPRERFSPNFAPVK